MADRISSLDAGYEAGDLSLFPLGIDNFESLYKVTNNAETKLTQGMNYTNQFIVVEDATSFPNKGLLKIGQEIIYYNSKSTTIFRELKRGFVGSKQTPHSAGDKVLGSVMAEHHNTLKDAVINIENNLGTKTDPVSTSLNGILSDLEIRFLNPKPKFRAFPVIGAPPLKVRFQNFTDGSILRNLWDFGDGTTSLETNPIHTYQKEGVYTVKLSIITTLGAHGIVTKKDYIKVDNNEQLAFFYADVYAGTSIDTAGNNATVFTLVDQTQGDIVSRYWAFDDGQTTTVDDPDVHTVTHQYQNPGTYTPTLFVVFINEKLKKISLGEEIVVT